jgi:hypothetical protein
MTRVDLVEIQNGAGRAVAASGREAAVAEFIRTKGVTRCPTACVLPTQGLVPATDRAALKEYAVARDRLRQAKAESRARSLWTF